MFHYLFILLIKKEYFWTKQRMIFYNLLLLYVQKMLNFVSFYNSINRIKGHDFSFTCTYLVKKIYVNRILIILTFRSLLFVLIVALSYPKLIFHASYWCVHFIPRLPVKMKNIVVLTWSFKILWWQFYYFPYHVLRS